MIDAFLDELEAPMPSPAGASASAAAAAMAASLLALAARASTAWTDREGTLRRARVLRERLVALGAEDVRALAEAMGRQLDARTTGGDAGERHRRGTLADAADAPLEIARAAAEVAGLAALTARRCKPSVRPDAVTAALLAEAACRAAAQIVEANLGTSSEDGRLEVADQARAAARDAARRASRS